MIAWVENVNKKILRQSSWENPVGIIADETRSGKRKIRRAHSIEPLTFLIIMHFSHTEYILFQEWFHYALQKGAETFQFPQIDGIGNTLKEYRFAPNSKLQFNNLTGKIIEAKFTWETV